VRISVIHSGDNFTLDLPSGQIGATLQAFEDQCGPLTADRCTAVAVAARDDDVHVGRIQVWKETPEPFSA
jgi:hypothetical protein